MPTALRQIAESARAAWDHASSLLLAARLDGVSRADHDALADYADEQRDRWLRADNRARHEADQRRVLLDAEPDYYTSAGGRWYDENGGDVLA